MKVVVPVDPCKCCLPSNLSLHKYFKRNKSWRLFFWLYLQSCINFYLTTDLILNYKALMNIIHYIPFETKQNESQHLKCIITPSLPPLK